MNPLVSIMTPVYNALPYLHECFESILRQSYRPMEYIIFDDGSDDGSRRCIEAYLPEFRKNGIDVTLISSKENKGQAKALSCMLSEIHGEFFTWIDADDYFAEDSIAEFLRFFEEFPQFKYVRGSYEMFSDGATDFPLKTVHYMDKAGDIFEGVLRGEDYALSGAYMMRTDAFFACYPDKVLPISQEGQNFQMILPMASRFPCGFINKTMFFYRIHPESHSHHKRSFRDVLTRNDNFYMLKLDILRYCEGDTQRYAEIAKEAHDRTEKEIMQSAVIHARKEMKEKINNV